MKILILFSLFLISCSMEYRFQSNKDASPVVAPQPTEPPNNSQNNPEPPLVDPDTGLPIGLKYAQGSCSDQGTALLSCLECQSVSKAKEADLSEKAKSLMLIMNQACKIKNKSDPSKEMTGTAEKIFSYLSSGNKSLYPDSTMTVSQKNLITQLASVDSKLYKKMFGGLWYQPPYSDDFETYFGISTQEAKSLFCFETPTETFGLNSYTPLQSKEYIDCQYSSGWTSCRETEAYLSANTTRGQLQKTIQESLANPYQSGELVPVTQCFWETVEGVYNQDFEDALVSWVNRGYQIGIYFEEGSPRCESFNKRSSELKGKMKAAAYVCEDL